MRLPPSRRQNHRDKPPIQPNAARNQLITRDSVRYVIAEDASDNVTDRIRGYRHDRTYERGF